MATTIFLINPYIPTITYLLDDYSATAAYSLRQLKTGVSNVVRVRRSSDNAEQDFNATEVTDGTLTTFTGANDGFVTTIYDQVGSNDLVKAAATAQPKLVSSGTLNTDSNGNPYCYFDGTGDELISGQVIDGTESDIWTFATFSSSQAQFYIDVDSTGRLGAESDTSLNREQMRVRVNAVEYDTFDGSQSTGAKLMTLKYDRGTELRLYLNGTSELSDGTLTNNDITITNGYMWLGRRVNGNYETSEFQELILFNTDQSTNKTAIETEISTHYSL